MTEKEFNSHRKQNNCTSVCIIDFQHGIVMNYNDYIAYIKACETIEKRGKVKFTDKEWENEVVMEYAKRSVK